MTADPSTRQETYVEATTGRALVRSAESAATLWKTEPASAEGSVWEGEYRGIWIRLVRTTDPNYHTGRNPHHEKDATETRWDGFMAAGSAVNGVRWDCVAECCGTRREALRWLKSYIDGILSAKVES
jgi:hypothetical protein